MNNDSAIDVIPAILPKSAQELEQAIRRLEPYVERVHIDIADGVFVPNTTITGYQELAHIKTPIIFDVHLMIQNPLDIMYHWYEVGSVDRMIIHAEVRDGFKDMLEQIRLTGRKTGVAINPGTQWTDVIEFADMIDYLQFMTVNPGFQGRQFLQDIVYEITDFRQEYPDIPVAVDGGINPETAKQAISAGANILVSGSYILNSDNPGATIQTLRTL